MKKLLLLLMLFTVSVYGQKEPVPVGFTTASPANYKVNATTGQFAEFLGTAGGWAWFVSQKILKVKLDSIQYRNDSLRLLKVDKVTGKKLSDKNYTDADSTKLASIDAFFQSKRTIYASGIGCALNLNKTTRTGTDDIIKIQKAVDSLNVLGGGTLIIDGDALIGSTLVIKSNVKIVNQGTVLLKDAANCQMLTTNLTGDIISNKNIYIEGGEWNANGDHQNRWENADSTDLNNKTWNFGFWIGSVNGYTLRDVTVRNSKTFSIVLSQAYNGYINNTKSTQDSIYIPSFPTYHHNQDGLHLWGSIDNLLVDGYTSRYGDDDAIAVNTSENIGYDTVRRGGVRTGAITNCVFQNITMDSCATAIRLHGSIFPMPIPPTNGPYTNGVSWMDNITFQNIHGTIITRGIIQENCPIGKLTFSGYHVKNIRNDPADSIDFNLTASTINQLHMSDIDSGMIVHLGTINYKTGDYFTPTTYYKKSGGTISGQVTIDNDLLFTGNRNIIFRNTSAAAGVIAFQNSASVQKAAIASYYNIADEGDLEFLNGTTTNMILRSNGTLFLGYNSDPSSGNKIGINGNSYFGGNIYSTDNISALSFTDRTPFYKGDALNEIKKIRGKNGEIDHTTLPAFVQVHKKQDINKDQLVTKTRQKTTQVERQVDSVELKLIKGKYTKLIHKVTKVVDEPIFNEVNIYDESGKKILDSLGHAVKNKIPILEQYQVTEKVKIGERDIPERDLGGMISVLTVAVQQLLDRIEKLEMAKVPITNKPLPKKVLPIKK